MSRLDKAQKLGDVVNELMQAQIKPRHTRFRRLEHHWSNILPSELADHSRIEDISSGRLLVKADAPSYKYELQLCSEDILRQLQSRCSALRIKEIKIIVG